MRYDRAVRIQKINEAIRHLFENTGTNTAGKFYAFDKSTGRMVKTDTPGAQRVFGVGDDGDLSRAYMMDGSNKKVYLNRPSYNKPLTDRSNAKFFEVEDKVTDNQPIQPVLVPSRTTQPGSSEQGGGGFGNVGAGYDPGSRHPSQLPADQLGAKTGQTPAEVQLNRDLVGAARQQLDATRPSGQPASFTPSGASPAPGRRADGTAVPPPPATNAFNAGGSVNRPPMTTPPASVGPMDVLRNIGMPWPFNSSTTNYNRLERK
jgi:hypothetical protein